jgi:hypothetical protein
MERDWKGTGSDMSNVKYCIIACLLAVQAAGSTVLAQTTITNQITTDTYIDSLNPTENFGLSGSDKVVINNVSPSVCRTLFDLPPNLWSYSPSQIESAIVSFYVFSDNTGTYNVSLFPLTRAFGVGMWNGKGTPPAQANGATWLTYDGTNSWTIAGGDFDSANSVVGLKGTLGAGGNNNGRFFTFDITSLLANPTTDTELQDYGTMLAIDVGATEPPAGSQDFASFTSADSTSSTIPYLPSVALTVVPEPSSLILVTVGLGAITCFRKKRSTRC